MANQEHLNILDQGVETWNRWREQNPKIRPDLPRADLSDRDLTGVNLSNANLNFARLTSVNLTGANLNEADLLNADLSPTPFEDLDETWLRFTILNEATLVHARLQSAALTYAQFVNADLTGAQLWWTHAFMANFTDATLVRAEITEARLDHATFQRANLTDAYLSQSNLRNTNFEGAILRGSNVYGISAWDVNLSGATQAGLVITRQGGLHPQPAVTVDNLEVAQFIYLLINNERVRHVIDTITSKVVLILGRFTDERKPLLDALRENLRQRDYVPIMFDFDPPNSRDLTETVSTLAHMARFVIVDITDPRSVPQELLRIVPNLPSVPVQPLLDGSTDEYGMFEHFKRYPWVLEPYRYESLDGLLTNLAVKIIAPAEAKAEEMGNSR